MPIRPCSASLPAGLGRLVVVCLILAASGCANSAATDQQPPTGGAAGGAAGGGRGRGAGGGPVPVVTARAVVKAVPVTIPAVGTAEPLATVQVRSQVTGQLSAIHFAEGQEVRKGAPLFTLDARPFQAALEQAQAVLARDTAQAKNAEAQQNRYADLFKRGLIPRDQYEAQSANASALQATLASDRAQIENARLNVQYTRITAPITGRTGALGVHMGDLVRANDTTPMVVINQLSPLYVTFAVPGRYLGDIRRFQARNRLVVRAQGQGALAPGSQPPPNPTQSLRSLPAGSSPAPGSQPDTPGVGATVVVDPGPAESGVVTFIDNTVDATTGTIKLKGTFQNQDHALWPGLFVQVTLDLTTDPNALVVPAAAVQVSQSGQFVYVVKSDRSVEIRNVTVLRQQGEESVIAKGLAAGEEVVTEGQLRLTPGSRVTTGARGGSGGAGGPSGQGGGGQNGRTGGRRGNVGPS